MCVCVCVCPPKIKLDNGATAKVSTPHISHHRLGHWDSAVCCNGAVRHVLCGHHSFCFEMRSKGLKRCSTGALEGNVMLYFIKCLLTMEHALRDVRLLSEYSKHFLTSSWLVLSDDDLPLLKTNIFFLWLIRFHRVVISHCSWTVQ